MVNWFIDNGSVSSDRNNQMKQAVIAVFRAFFTVQFSLINTTGKADSENCVHDYLGM